MWEYAWIDKHKSSLRVVRGGSCYDDAKICTSTIRMYRHFNDKDDIIGFRLATLQKNLF